MHVYTDMQKSIILLTNNSVINVEAVELKRYNGITVIDCDKFTV